MAGTEIESSQSVAFLYGIGPTLAGGSLYIATSISHATECIAIVGLFLPKTRIQVHPDVPKQSANAGPQQESSSAGPVSVGQKRVD
jgi:hypothetical protein